MQSKLTQLVGLACCVVLIALASTRMAPINEGRKSLNMMGSASPLENSPPEYAFAIQAFGAFRGLITDIAFIRAERFKDEGRYYDAMQLAKWICALQPHFPSVWEFAAWNMSWNISVTTYTGEERWNWVYNGVKLLRDQGIPLNPRAVNLYKQLAWTFNNKMGEFTDEFHYTYKCNWAWRMHLLLGPPPDPLTEVDPNTLADAASADTDVNSLLEAARETFRQNEEKRRRTAQERGDQYEIRSPDQVTGAKKTADLTPSELARRAAYERIRRIDETPARLTELYTRYPDVRRMVAELRGLGIVLSDDTLSEDEYWREEGLAFSFFVPYRKVADPTSTLATITGGDAGSDPERVQGEKIDAILGVRSGDPAGEALVRWLQRKVLREVYKLDTGHMAQVVQSFGPVDWRSVDAQGLYWVTKGLIESGETINEFRNDKANTARIMFFSLRNLFLRNHIIFEPYSPKIELSYLNLGRDMNFIESMHEAYLNYGPLFDPRPGSLEGGGAAFRVGHINFLNEAIRLLYLSGREAEAEHYYRYVQNVYRLNAAGEPNRAFAKSLHDYVMDNFLESMDKPGLREARLALDGLLYAANSQLAAGDVARYVSIVDRARELHADYMKDKKTGTRMEDRISLPDFIQMQADALMGWLAQPPVSPLQTIQKVRLWRAAPLYLRQRAYDELKPIMEAECKLWNFDPARAFPEPKGMEEFRRQHPPLRETQPRPRGDAQVETPSQQPGGG